MVAGQISMQLRDPERFADAVNRLRGGRSYGRLSHYISRVTNGEVDVEPLWLYRIANGKVGSVRAVDTPTRAFLFGLAMMMHGCQEDGAAQDVMALGRVIMENLLGSAKLAQLALSEIETLARQLAHTSDLKQVLERCLSSWSEAEDVR
jgi:hypothetical protein